MKKVFLSCDYTYPLYHPAANIDPILDQILGEDFAITYKNEHFESLEAWDYAKFDLVVLYNDHWIDKSPTVHQQVQALLTYVARGGGLLILHNADMGVDPETAQLQGAKLVKTLCPQNTGTFTYVPAQHPIAKGVEAFTLEDELFDMVHSTLSEKQNVLTVSTPRGDVPAGWAQNFGLGKVCYLMPGHSAAAFENAGYQTLIARAAKWCTGSLEDA